MQATMTFNEATGKYDLVTIPDSKDPEVNLEQARALRGITGLEVMGIPIGAAAIGGATAFLIDGLFDRFLPQVTGSMANLLAAWALVQFGSGVLGRETVKYAAVFLAYEAIRDPIESALAPIMGVGASQAGQATARQWEQHLRQQPESAMSRYAAVF